VRPGVQRPSGGTYLRLVGLGAAVGVPAALVAAAFLSLVHQLQHWLWHDLPDALGGDAPQWYLVLLLPVCGALIVLGARLLLPGDGGHLPLDGLSTKPTPPRHVPGVALAALGTLGFGAVLGPEAPVIALGSAVGVAVSRLYRSAGEQGTAILSNAGSFSAISALFGGPIVAGMLLVEGGVGIGAALLPALLPGLVAAAIGYLIFIGLDHWPGLGAPGLAVPDLPRYEGTHIYDLLIAIVVGATAAVVVAAVHRLGGRVARIGARPLVLAGGAAVGALALVGDALGADPQDVLFSGQNSIATVVETDSTQLVLVLLATKFLAYGISLGCGFRGGPIFPAIFLGVALAALAVVWFDTSPTLAIAVGASAAMAAQTRLLFSPLIFAALLVGTAGTDAVPAAALASATAWLAISRLQPAPAPDQPAPTRSAPSPDR
jgi:H+/Cl- antiporter ClcA